MGLVGGDVPQQDLKWILKQFGDEEKEFDSRKLRNFLRKTTSMLTVGIPYFVYKYPSRIRVRVSASQAVMSGGEVLTYKKHTMLEHEKVPNYIYGAIKAMQTNPEKCEKLFQKISEAVAFENNVSADKSVKRNIKLFQKLFDIEEKYDKSYETFNDFFARHVSNRSVEGEGDGNVVCSPADCRMTVFESIESAKNIWIKGKDFSIEKLLPNCEDINNFRDCSLCVCRLAPYDSHQFYLPVDAKGIITKELTGKKLFPTIPDAIKDPDANVYTENVRQILQIKTEEFGTVYFVAIGSIYVGSIQLEENLTEANYPKVKGTKLGKFQYGGSTILLLFQAGKIKFQDALKKTSSSEKVETYMKMGQTVGKRIVAEG